MSSDQVDRPLDLAQQLIRFDTTNPPGGERECIGWIEAKLRDAGLETRTLGRDPDRPNLVARLPGDGRAPPLLVYGHVDVVPTAGQDWTHPPFGADVVDGFLWGRGALDMKSGLAMQIAALLRAQAEGLRAPGDVIFCALADEEVEGEYGAGFLVDEHRELFAGVRYALGEFGGFSLATSGRRFYPIQVAEKQMLGVTATIRGAGGHASLRVAGSGPARLAEFLGKLETQRLPVHVTPVAGRMIREMAEALPFPAGAALLGLLRPRLADRLIRAGGSAFATFDPLLHNTATATIIHVGTKRNVIPSEITVELDGRLLPGFASEDLVRELRAIVGPDVELHAETVDAFQGEPDYGLFETLGGILRELDGDGRPIPLLLSGVTDARHFRKLGIQTYGFLPMRLPEGFDFTHLIHAPDERIPVDALDFGAEAIFRALGSFH